VLPQPPHSSDLTPADYYLFPRLKEFLKGQQFASCDDAEAAIMIVLNEVSKNGLQDFFQSGNDKGAQWPKGSTPKVVYNRTPHQTKYGSYIIFFRTYYACTRALPSFVATEYTTNPLHSWFSIPHFHMFF
jgi:hypothetical protein